MVPPGTLRSRADIDRVFRTGKRYRAPDLTLVCVPKKEGSLRVAISVKKGLGAVQRNKVRRRVREALRIAGPLDGGADGVVIAGKSIQLLTFIEIQRQMCQILEEAGLLRK